MIICLSNDHILFFARFDDTCFVCRAEGDLMSMLRLLLVLCSILSHPVVWRKSATTEVRDQAIENKNLPGEFDNDDEVVCLGVISKDYKLIERSYLVLCSIWRYRTIPVLRVWLEAIWCRCWFRVASGAVLDTLASCCWKKICNQSKRSSNWEFQNYMQQVQWSSTINAGNCLQVFFFKYWCCCMSGDECIVRRCAFEFVLWFQLVFAKDCIKPFRWQYILWTGPKAIRNQRSESYFRSLGGFGSLIMLMDECIDWISHFLWMLTSVLYWIWRFGFACRAERDFGICDPRAR